MNKEMMGMTNEEMLVIILGRMDKLDEDNQTILERIGAIEERMDALEARMDAIEKRMDALEARMDAIEERMDALEARVDAMEKRIDDMKADFDMEIQAVRTEMEVVYKALKKDIAVLDSKIDRLSYTKDVDGFDKINIRIEVLEDGYRELREMIS